MSPTPRPFTATFVISAGRCGTQWLADTLGHHYVDLAVVRHEPIDHKYCPRLALRSEADLRDHPYREEVLGHIRYIRTVLRERNYVETGWPAFASIPVLRDLLGDQLKIIHLTRHPVPSACSMVTHRYYQPDLRDDGYTRFAILEPIDHGVRHKQYAASWDRLSPYEKCLFHWAEINTYGVEVLGSYPIGSQLRMRAEHMLDGDAGGFADLVRFLGLPLRSAALDATRTPFDMHRTRTRLAIDWQQIRSHPEITRLAETLGYDPLDASADDLVVRYHASPGRTAHSR